jgi:hypothetical protein
VGTGQTVGSAKEGLDHPAVTKKLYPRMLVQEVNFEACSVGPTARVHDHCIVVPNMTYLRVFSLYRVRQFEFLSLKIDFFFLVSQISKRMQCVHKSMISSRRFQHQPAFHLNGWCNATLAALMVPVPSARLYVDCASVTALRADEQKNMMHAMSPE